MEPDYFPHLPQFELIYLIGGDYLSILRKVLMPSFYSILLNKPFRTECEIYGIGIAYPPANIYKTLFRQRHIQVGP